MAAKVPTNNNPWINTNPVKPAIWVEIGDLSNYPATMAYSDGSTQFLSDAFKQAANATKINIESAINTEEAINSGLPNIYIWEKTQSTQAIFPDIENYAQKGMVINRALIQLVRDMSD